jgi:hypothetical protein
MKDLFVTVPETTLPGGRIVPAFRVGQYVCTQGTGGRAAITAEGTPWVRINFAEAKAACAAAGYALITESQALALAYQVALQPENWTGGAIGKGKLYQGLRKWTVRSAQAGDFVSSDPDERRWFALPDGQRIFDVAGNVFTWVSDDVQGDEQGLVAKPFAKDSPSLVIPFPDKDKGQGWTPRTGADWSGDALVRGGYWRSEAVAGAFRLSNDWPGYRGGYVGFRCTQPIGH